MLYFLPVSILSNTVPWSGDKEISMSCWDARPDTFGVCVKGGKYLASKVNAHLLGQACEILSLREPILSPVQLLHRYSTCKPVSVDESTSRNAMGKEEGNGQDLYHRINHCLQYQ